MPNETNRHGLLPPVLPRWARPAGWDRPPQRVSLRQLGLRLLQRVSLRRPGRWWSNDISLLLHEAGHLLNTLEQIRLNPVRPGTNNCLRDLTLCRGMAPFLGHKLEHAHADQVGLTVSHAVGAGELPLLQLGLAHEHIAPLDDRVAVRLPEDVVGQLASLATGLEEDLLP